MTTIEQLVGEFIDAWNAGRRPAIDAYLQRARPSERDELAAQLTTWLEIAPTPDFSDATRAAIESEPALASAFASAAATREPLAQRLPTLRQRAGLAVRDVAARLAVVFSLQDED